MSRVIKKDLISQVSNKTGLKTQDVTLVIESFLDEVASHLGRGTIVALREFGTFDIRVSREKIGRNPKEPTVPIHIPARNNVRFRPGDKLESSVASLPVQS
jgi:nucleoid DNA-binding protein